MATKTTWRDYRDITDRELAALRAHEHERARFRGLDTDLELALTKNRTHVLHEQSRDVCAAHLFAVISRASLEDPQGYEVRNTDLGLTSDEWKRLVRKAFTAPKGIVFKRRRLLFH